MKTLTIALTKLDKSEQAVYSFINDDANYFTKGQLSNKAKVQLSKLENQLEKDNAKVLSICISNNISSLRDYADLDTSGCGFQGIEEQL